MLEMFTPGMIVLLKLFAILFVVIVTLKVILNKTFGKERTKAISISMLLCCFSLILTLLLSEYVVRLIYADISTTADGYSYFTGRWEKQNPPTLNSFGFREREITNKPTPGVFRIAVIGDSLTYGQGILEQDRLTNILEKRLNKTKKAYEVLNFGRSGAETIDQIDFLKKYVSKVNPNYILLQWYVNDFEGHDKSRRPFRQYLRLIPSDLITGFFIRNSALYYLINKQWKVLQSKLGGGPKESYTEYLRNRFKDSESNDSIIAKKQLQSLIKLSKQLGIPIGMIVYPDVFENVLDGYPLGFMLERVLKVCLENDIRCLDMRPMIASVKPYTKLWANKFDGHPNKLSNTLAAKAVSEYFLPTWISIND